MRTYFILDFASYTASVQIAHWQADSVTNAHKTLGDLYEKMSALSDEFAELTLGKQGSRLLPEASPALVRFNDNAALITTGLQLVAKARAEVTTAQDEDLANTLADMSAALNLAKYLLQI